MNNLTTRKIVLGMLMALVLAFSVQGIADAADLPLREVSGDLQTKPAGNPFEITFEVGERSNTATRIQNTARQLTTDGTPKNDTTSTKQASTAVLINSAGYEVEYIGATRYRSAEAPDITGYYRTSSNSDWEQANNTNQLYIGDTNTTLYYHFPDNGTTVYRVYAATEVDDADGNPIIIGNTSKPLTGVPEDPYPAHHRYYYNEEAVKIEVDKDPGAVFSTETGVMAFELKASGFQRPTTRLAEDPVNDPNALQGNLTLVCTPSGADDAGRVGTYRVKITDDTPAFDQPGTPAALRAYIEFTIYVTLGTTSNVRVALAGNQASRILTTDAIVPVNNRFDFGDNRRVHYQVTKGNGTLYVGTLDIQHTTPAQDLLTHGGSSVYLNTNNTTNEVTVSYDGQDPRVDGVKIVFEYTGTGAPTTTSTTSTPSTTSTTSTPSVTANVPSSVTGIAGGTRVLRFTTNAASVFVGSPTVDTFPIANISTPTQSGTTHTRTLTLPSPGTYTLGVYINNTRHQVTVTVTAAAQTGGNLTVRVDPFTGAPGTTATVTVTASTIAADSSAQPASVTVNLTATGGTLSRPSVVTGFRWHHHSHSHTRQHGGQ